VTIRMTMAQLQATEKQFCKPGFAQAAAASVQGGTGVPPVTPGVPPGDPIFTFSLKQYAALRTAWDTDPNPHLHKIIRPPGLGDVVHKIAGPLGRALGMPCFDANGKLIPGSDCDKRRESLNAAPAKIASILKKITGQK
jgi:hypothetical protein